MSAAQPSSDDPIDVAREDVPASVQVVTDDGVVHLAVTLALDGPAARDLAHALLEAVES